MYENSQARERTQILMDVANGFADGGIHVGTEDMSEFADGWCTYNGDHISMYDVNAGSTKTMVQMVVRYVAETTEDKVLAKALLDVLDTPVSPELLPPDAQRRDRPEERGLRRPVQPPGLLPVLPGRSRLRTREGAAPGRHRLRRRV